MVGLYLNFTLIFLAEFNFELLQRFCYTSVLQV